MYTMLFFGELYHGFHNGIRTLIDQIPTGLNVTVYMKCEVQIALGISE